MKVWKRCFTAILAFIIMVLSVDITQAAGTTDSYDSVWTATAAYIVAEYYELSEKEAAVMCNSVVRTGEVISIETPWQNGTEGKIDLTAVDYLDKKIYAKECRYNGYIWIPTEAVLIAEGEEQECLPLTADRCIYKDEEYDASASFTYSGNSYVVNVHYQVSVAIEQEEQERLLNIPQVFAQIVNNLEKDLKGMRLNMKYLGQMVPYLKELMNLQLPVEETYGEAAEDTENRTEPAFDEEEDAELFEVIDALYAQYMSDPSDPGLNLYKIIEEYRSGINICVAYSLEHGREIQEESRILYEYLDFLDSCSHLADVYKKLKTVDPELYGQLKYLYQYINNFLGSAKKPGPLVSLKDPESWTLLDEDIRSSVFRTEYNDMDFASLESAVYGLRNVTVTSPEVTDTVLPAAQRDVNCQITFWNVSVHVSGSVVAGEAGDGSLTELPAFSQQLLLLDGTSREDIRKAIGDMRTEQDALDSWNAENSRYKINTANYVRTESDLPEVLKGDINNYSIVYQPREYTVDTNFAGRNILPYGYRMLLPEYEDEESSYDYVVKTSDGKSLTYEQGVLYTITDDAEIIRKEGTAKKEYRLYDFIARDEQYGITDVSVSILSSSAINSPVLKIRMPDESLVSEVTKDDGVYSLDAKSYSAGIIGMTWEPYKAMVMNGSQKLLEVLFDENGHASWKCSSYTHVNVSYQLKITQVKGGIFYQTLDDEDILYALNLPYELVKSVSKENQLLSGEEGYSAKSIYQKMDSVKQFITPTMLGVVKDEMVTDEGRNAVIGILGSEDSVIRGIHNENLGYGGWSSTSDELALYKYLSQCEEADWSLSLYYRNGYYKKISEQAGKLAERLEAIVNDRGFDSLIASLGSVASGKKEEIIQLIPYLRYLSEHLNGPHEALKTDDADFPVLIERLLEAEGSVSEYSEANGVYANTEIRKNSQNIGELHISVKIGSRELTASMEYYLEGEDGSSRYHTFTEEEEAKMYKEIELLESQGKLTEAEKIYYDLDSSVIPKTGDSLSEETDICLVYTPKRYSVTIKGVPFSEYHDEFYYGSDYTIQLPAKSKNVKDGDYYVYEINKVTRTVKNGTTGTYRFKKADLTALFVNGSYEIIRKEVKTSTETTSDSQSDSSKPSSSDSSEKDSEDSEKTTTTGANKTDTVSDKKTEEADGKTEVSETAEKYPVIPATEVIDDADEGIPESQLLSTGGNASRTSDGRQGGFGSIAKILPFILGLLAVLMVGTAFYVLRKKRAASADYDGAPMVDYEISDDDE